jgi:hypothetical protein
MQTQEKKFISVIHLNLPVSFRISKSTASFRRGNIKNPLVSFDTIQWEIQLSRARAHPFSASFLLLFNESDFLSPLLDVKLKIPVYFELAI